MLGEGHALEKHYVCPRMQPHSRPTKYRHKRGHGSSGSLQGAKSIRAARFSGGGALLHGSGIAWRGPLLSLVPLLCRNVTSVVVISAQSLDNGIYISGGQVLLHGVRSGNRSEYDRTTLPPNPIQAILPFAAVLPTIVHGAKPAYVLNCARLQPVKGVQLLDLAFLRATGESSAEGYPWHEALAFWKSGVRRHILDDAEVGGF